MDVERVKDVLRSKLSEADLAKFTDADLCKLAANSYTDTGSFEAAERQDFKDALPPDRGALVAILFKAFHARKNLALEEDGSGDSRPKKRYKPFTRLPTQFELPFRGREDLMQRLAGRVSRYFNTFADSGISREEMLFVSLEGLAGAGKTRSLIEAKEGVRRNLSTGKLAHMYVSGAVEALYITFNGSAVGSSKPHSFPRAFEKRLRDRGPKLAGDIFMQTCIASEILYGEPFATLPVELQEEIIAEDTVSCLKKLAAHVREGLGIADDKMVALYLLVDEAQMLGREVIEKGGDGIEFLRGMLTWIGNVMTSTAGESAARQAGLGFIPLLGGTVLPVVGKYGISDWPNVCEQVEQLDLTSAVEILRLSITDPSFGAVEKQLEVLLEDCSCMPRLIRYIHSAWMDAAKSNVTGQDLILHLRTSVCLDLKIMVDKILKGNRDMVKRMTRLCLTGVEVEKPAETSLELAECGKGYVYAKEIPGKDSVQYRCPMMLLHALALRLGISNRMGVLSPQPSKGDSLEYAFLDMLHARMRVYDGTQRSLGELFLGASGDHNVLSTKVILSSGRGKLVQEQFQFCVSGREARFYIPNDQYLIAEDDNVRFPLPSYGDLFKCKQGVTVSDARLFLKDAQKQDVVYEIWIQLKGQQARISVAQANAFAEAAFHPRFTLEGRRKIYVLCSANGFVDAKEMLMENVLLLDLQNFMPEYFRRCSLCFTD